MEILKRKILIETLRSRKDDPSYGIITATTIYLNVFLTQNIDDLGIFTDMPYTDEPWDHTPLVNYMTGLGFTSQVFPFLSGASVNFQPSNDFDMDLRIQGRDVTDYYSPSSGYRLTAFTDSKLGDYKSYANGGTYLQNKPIDKYFDYTDTFVSMITFPPNPNPDISAVTYVEKAKLDSSIGTDLQTTGFKYVTYPLTGATIGTVYNIGTLASIMNPDNPSEINTIVSYMGVGWNSENTSLSAIVKEEIYLGIVSPPNVESDIYINRGSTSAIEYHLRLSEIQGIDHLVKYGNGFYNVVKNNLI